ncbi:nitroreductase family protein [Sediminispirochaeta bajacaliforniensis]|uniref:nitroreductase family protein n=1 Tax=Sediminispirochaeta bajacaliforniensis TaxID=148 RepID=UPI00035E5074|nr:nitroreductase family protein [Sediminispirochaeta bajacaliforniensis]
MNEVIDSMMSRKSVRAFLDKTVEEEKKALLIEAARRAPTAGNLMLYSIIDVTDQELKEKLAISCDHQPFIAKAPIVLIFLADPNRLWDLYRAGQVPESCKESGEAFIQEPALSDLMLASCDAMAAAQNVVIAAQSLGLGSCYIGDIMERIEEHREILGLPPSVFPLTMLVIGYPTEAASRRKQTDRYPMWAMTFENHYKSLTPEELATMTGKEDVKKEALRIYKKKTGADFSFEMRRSVKKGLMPFTETP